MSFILAAGSICPPVGSLLALRQAKQAHSKSEQEFYKRGAIGAWIGLLIGVAIIALCVGLSVLSFGALPLFLGVSLAGLWACSVIGRVLGLVGQTHLLDSSKKEVSIWVVGYEILHFGLMGSFSDGMRVALLEADAECEDVDVVAFNDRYYDREGSDVGGSRGDVPSEEFTPVEGRPIAETTFGL